MASWLCPPGVFLCVGWLAALAVTRFAWGRGGILGGTTFSQCGRGLSLDFWGSWFLCKLHCSLPLGSRDSVRGRSSSPLSRVRAGSSVAISGVPEIDEHVRAHLAPDIVRVQRRVCRPVLQPPGPISPHCPTTGLPLRPLAPTSTSRGAPNAQSPETLPDVCPPFSLGDFSCVCFSSPSARGWPRPRPRPRVW